MIQWIFPLIIKQNDILCDWMVKITLISWICWSRPPISAYVSCGAFSSFITVTIGSASSPRMPITAWTLFKCVGLLFLFLLFDQQKLNIILYDLRGQCIRARASLCRRKTGCSRSARSRLMWRRWHGCRRSPLLDYQLPSESRASRQLWSALPKNERKSLSHICRGESDQNYEGNAKWDVRSRNF